MSTRRRKNANGGSAVSNGKGGIREITLVFTLALLGVGLAMLAAFTPWYEAARAETAIVDIHVPLFDPPDMAAQGPGQ
jgi:hypothetical protein